MKTDSIHRLWLYNNWANQLLINTFRKQINQIPEKCMVLMSHIVNAQMIWVCRINVEQTHLTVWQEHSLDECLELHESSSKLLQGIINSEDPTHPIEVRYQNSRMEPFTTSVEDILLQIFNHGTYHRAQIATEMKRNGLETINTDYITYCRGKVS